MFKKGLSVSKHFESGGFLRSHAGLGWPDIRFHCLPAAVHFQTKEAKQCHGFMVLTHPNTPKSCG